jgi:hypothetical protein
MPLTYTLRNSKMEIGAVCQEDEDIRGCWKVMDDYKGCRAPADALLYVWIGCWIAAALSTLVLCSLGLMPERPLPAVRSDPTCVLLVEQQSCCSTAPDMPKRVPAG